MPDSIEEKTIQRRQNIEEDILLVQIVSLLVKEELITPEEQIRFLALLKEER